MRFLLRQSTNMVLESPAQGDDDDTCDYDEEKQTKSKHKHLKHTNLGTKSKANTQLRIVFRTANTQTSITYKFGDKI